MGSLSVSKEGLHVLSIATVSSTSVDFLQSKHMV